MKRFMAFVNKEFYHILRDQRTILILLVMPVVQIMLFGFAISTEVKNIRLAVLDPSNDAATARIAERMSANPYFTLVRNLHTREEIEQGLLKNEFDLAMVFQGQFNETLLHTGKASIQLIADGSDPNTATLIGNYAANIIGSYQQELSGAENAQIRIVPSIKLLYNPQMKAAYNFVPGVMGLILMLICAMMTAISIVREKERGTMEILLVSPIKPLSIILAKAVPYFVLSCVNLATILLLAVFVLDVPVAGSLFWLSILSLIFIFVGLSLGLLVSTLVKTQVSAMLASGMVLMMPVMLLSGMIFPVENMPGILRVISGVIPARWYIAGVKKIMIQGVDVRFILKEMIILAGMAALLIMVSLRNFKNRLE